MLAPRTIITLPSRSDLLKAQTATQALSYLDPELRVHRNPFLDDLPHKLPYYGRRRPRVDAVKELVTHLAKLLPRSNEILAIMPTKYTATRTEVILATNVPVHGAPQAQSKLPMRITLDNGAPADPPQPGLLRWLLSQELGSNSILFNSHVHIVQALLIDLFSTDKETISRAHIKLSFYITYAAASKIHARIRQETRNFYTIVQDVDLSNCSLTPDLKVALPKSRERLRDTLDDAAKLTAKLKPADVPLLDLPTDEEWTQLQSYRSDHEARIFHKILKAILRGTLASVTALKQFKINKVSKHVNPEDREDRRKQLAKDLHYLIVYAASWCEALAELVSNYEDALLGHLKFIQLWHRDLKTSVRAARDKPTEDIELDDGVWAPGVPDADLYDESTAPGIDGKVEDTDMDVIEELEYDPELESELRDYERTWADEALQWLKVASAHHRSVYYFFDYARHYKTSTAAKAMLCRLKIRVVDVEVQADGCKPGALDKLIDEARPTWQNRSSIHEWFASINTTKPTHRKVGLGSEAVTGAYHCEAILLSLVLLNKLRVRAEDVKGVLDISDATIRAFRVAKVTLGMTKRSCPSCFKLIRATQGAMGSRKEIPKFDIDFPAYTLRHSATALPPFLPASVAREVFTTVRIAFDNGLSRLNDAIWCRTMRRRQITEQADTEEEGVEEPVSKLPRYTEIHEI